MFRFEHFMHFWALLTIPLLTIFFVLMRRLRRAALDRFGERKRKGLAQMGIVERTWPTRINGDDRDVAVRCVRAHNAAHEAREHDRRRKHRTLPPPKRRRQPRGLPSTFKREQCHADLSPGRR